jgi:hypothetical protein
MRKKLRFYVATRIFLLFLLDVYKSCSLFAFFIFIYLQISMAERLCMKVRSVLGRVYVLFAFFFSKKLHQTPLLSTKCFVFFAYTYSDTFFYVVAVACGKEDAVKFLVQDAKANIFAKTHQGQVCLFDNPKFYGI